MSQIVSSTASRNARLKATRWPSRSVSASTPSQSKISASMSSPHALRPARAAELPDFPGHQCLHGVELRLEDFQRFVVSGVGLMVIRKTVDEDVLEVGRDVDLRAAGVDATLDDLVR